LSNPTNPSTANPPIPTAAQLADARLKRWHQHGEALLTTENLRGWINAAGLVLFAPRPQIASPAPSLVEAVLGVPTSSPTAEQSAEARSLLARLIAEGLAVPLNLLGAGAGTAHAGAHGDTPDYVASTAVFSYIFTLRGDKAWKQPPATSGALKVSHLALATHEALARRGPLSAYDLATEVGKEATEAAILRALAELWTHLRVFPLAQPNGTPALWELTGARFTKQIKAGANAGQPSALSALISLYLGQAVVAAEDEIESFLSPLASRSRIRDVIHALLSARQLDTLAVDGRTMLHMTGELPAFLAPESGPAALELHAVADSETASGTAAEENAPGTREASPRITKFVPKPRKIGTGYLAKAKPSKFAVEPRSASQFPASTQFPASKMGSSEPGTRDGIRPGLKDAGKSGFRPRMGSGPAPGRERRPFSKSAPAGFDKPWEEEKTRRLAAARKPSEVHESEVHEDVSDLAASEHTGDGAKSARLQAPRVYNPRTGAADDRRTFGGKPAFRGKPSFGDKPGFGGKPSFRGNPSFGEGRPTRRDFAPRGEGAANEARPPRKTFSKPGTFGRKRESLAARSSDDARPPRRDFAPRGDRPERGQNATRGARPAFGAPRAPGSYAPRPKGDRPSGGRPGGYQGDRGPRGAGDGSAPRKPYAPRGAGFFSGKPRPSDGAARTSGPREGQERGPSGDSGKRIYKKFDAPRYRPIHHYNAGQPERSYSSDGSARADGPRGDAPKPAGDFAPRRFAGKSASKSGGKPGTVAGKPGLKPGGGFARKKPFGKSGAPFAGKPDSTFAKFAGNRKPFGKKPPARKFKPTRGESA